VERRGGRRDELPFCCQTGVTEFTRKEIAFEIRLLKALSHVQTFLLVFHSTARRNRWVKSFVELPITDRKDRRPARRVVDKWYPLKNTKE
jgi:hypothetical protein